MAAIAFLTVATPGLRANTTNIATIGAIALIQGSTNQVLSTETFATPKQYKINTKQILIWLAQDEYAEGNYKAPSFPAGKKSPVPWGVVLT